MFAPIRFQLSDTEKNVLNEFVAESLDDMEERGYIPTYIDAFNAYWRGITHTVQEGGILNKGITKYNSFASARTAIEMAGPVSRTSEGWLHAQRVLKECEKEYRKSRRHN